MAERQPCARPGTRNGTLESLAWPVAAHLAAGETEAQSLHGGQLQRLCVSCCATSLARRDRVFKPECASSGPLRGPGACQQTSGWMSTREGPAVDGGELQILHRHPLPSAGSTSLVLSGYNSPHFAPSRSVWQNPVPDLRQPGAVRPALWRPR